MRQMYEQELDDGKLTLEIKVAFEEKEVSDPTQVNLGQKRQITQPKFDYKVLHQITLKDETKGTVDGNGYEVIFDSGMPTIIKTKSAQTTFLDEDSAENWGIRTNGRGEEIKPAADNLTLLPQNDQSEQEDEEIDIEDFEPDSQFEDDDEF